MRVDPELAEVGRVVRAEREARQLSQEELADRSGLHRNYIGGIERGERNVGIKAFLRLARAFGVHPSKLMAACRFSWTDS